MGNGEEEGGDEGMEGGAGQTQQAKVTTDFTSKQKPLYPLSLVTWISAPFL